METFRLFEIDCAYNHFGKRVYIFLAIVIEPRHRHVEQQTCIQIRCITMVVGVFAFKRFCKILIQIIEINIFQTGAVCA